MTNEELIQRAAAVVNRRPLGDRYMGDVANTRWWPPFCAAIDWLVAIILALEIAAGVNFH